MREPVIYSMQRGGATVACVVVLPNGKCIVSWPTSTIIYDSESDARAVHITHMGGRGEKTAFVMQMACEAFARGWHVCYQDRCEGCPDSSGPEAPHYIPENDREDYERGYWAMSRCMYGESYSPDRSKWQGAAPARPGSVTARMRSAAEHCTGEMFGEQAAIKPPKEAT